MSIMELGAIGELVGGIAVLVTLIFIAVQIRQNTHQLRENARTLRTNALDETQRISNELRRHVIDERSVAEIWVRGQGDPAALDEIDRTRFDFLAEELMYHYQSTFRRARSAGDPEHWDSFGPGTVPVVLSQPGLNDWWSRRRGLFFEDFVVEVDRIVSDAGAATMR